MMTFEDVMPHIFLWEGGYVDHPRDPGGATNMGITIGTLRRWRGEAVTKQDVQNLTKGEAEQIYKAYYWDVVRCDELPSGVNYVMMDAAVNSGPSASVKWIQKSLRVSVDGILGPVTMQAIQSHPDKKKLALDAVQYRELFLRRLSTFNTFGRGWINRLNHVRQVLEEGSWVI
jgi:lysozyme family protein